MSRWFKAQIYVKNPVDESPDYGRDICLDVNWQPGYPAYVRGAPEDCYPAEGDQFEILAARYDDGREVPDNIIEALSDDDIINILNGKAA